MKIKRIFTKASLPEFLRFCLVGVIATAIHYGVYWLLLFFMNASIAYSIGYVVSFVCNFFLTSYLTFRKAPDLRKGIGFGGAHLVNYLLHIGFLNLFLWLGLSETIAPFPVFCIVVPINFILVRYVFYRKQ